MDTAIPSTTAAPPVRSLRREWTGAFVVAELVGFLPPVLAGTTLVALDAAEPLLVLGLTAAGLLEGLAIGSANAWVLHRHAPAVDGRRWIGATVLGAGLAWLAGMGGSALLGAPGAPVGLLLVLMVPVWITGLLAMGFLQWRVLRRVVPRSGRWVGVSAGAWLVGVMIPVVALSVVPNAWPPLAHGIVGVLAAVAMGLVVGLLTGRALDGLLRRDAG